MKLESYSAPGGNAAFFLRITALVVVKGLQRICHRTLYVKCKQGVDKIVADLATQRM